MRYTARPVVNLVSHELLLYHNYIIDVDILSGLCAFDPVRKIIILKIVKHLEQFIQENRSFYKIGNL